MWRYENQIYQIGYHDLRFAQTLTKGYAEKKAEHEVGEVEPDKSAFVGPEFALCAFEHGVHGFSGEELSELSRQGDARVPSGGVLFLRNEVDVSPAAEGKCDRSPKLGRDVVKRSSIANKKMKKNIKIISCEDHKRVYGSNSACFFYQKFFQTKSLGSEDKILDAMSQLSPIILNY